MIDPNTIQIEASSDLTPTEAEQLIGKTVECVTASEYGLEIAFKDGTVLEIHTYEDSSLSVDVDWPDKPKPPSHRSQHGDQILEQMRNAQMMQELTSLVTPRYEPSLAREMYLDDLLK